MYDFINEFKELDNICFTDEYEALSIIYDSLCSVYDDLDYDFISDYVRFQVMEMDGDDFINSYDLDLEEDAEEEEKHQAIEKHLNDYTYYIGFYERDGFVYYLFDEF